MARITQVGTVGIPVDDQERALAFYRDALGFETRMDSEYGEGQRWLDVAPPGASTSIALVQSHDAYRAGVETGIRFSTDDVGGGPRRARRRAGPTSARSFPTRCRCSSCAIRTGTR